MESHWPLVNELEQAWTGVEESDRDTISSLDSYHHSVLILVCCFDTPYRKLKDVAGILNDPSRASVVS